MQEMGLTAAVLVVFLISLCFTTANASIGLGISPASITINDALRGGMYERTITIFNTCLLYTSDAADE